MAFSFHFTERDAAKSGALQTRDRYKR